MRTALVLIGGGIGTAVALLGVALLLIGPHRGDGSAAQWMVAGRQTLGMGAALALLALSSRLGADGTTPLSLVTLAAALLLSVGSTCYAVLTALRQRRPR